MSSHQIQLSDKTGKNKLFTPKELISVQVDSRSYLKLYPKRHHEWHEVESNLAFNINIATLTNSSLKKDAIIQALAEQMGTTTQINVHIQQFNAIASEQVFQPDRLELLSYHDKMGKVLDSAMTFVAGEETLKPTHLRPQGIQFAKDSKR